MSTATDNLATQIYAVTEAIRTAIVNPAVAIRLLQKLADYYPATDLTGTAAICRRCALVSLCNAVATYTPTSYQDALSLRATISDLLDTEIIAAADAGQTSTYTAFTALRQQVSSYLTDAAGTLASVTTWTLPNSMPALAAAWRLYADASRADDLIRRVNMPEPNFLPAKFSALAT